MADPTLILRDIHQPPAPPLWPLAPGWWALAAVIILVALATAWWMLRKRRRRREIEALFDGSVAAAASPTARIAAVSELLRRAARRRDPAADRLQGDDWLAFLDGNERVREFRDGPGRVLLEGGFRREVDPSQADALVRLARERFLGWMAP